MFVKWSCGCVGVRHESKGVVLKFCDADSDPFGCSLRDMSDKTSEPLSDIELDNLVKNLGRLLAWGQEARNFAQFFKHMAE